MSIINDNVCLVLNKQWCAIETKSPAQVFCMLMTGVAVALDTSDGNFVPTKFEDWLQLPVREQDDSIMTTKGPVRIPRVVVAVNYGSIPCKTPQFNLPNLREEFGGLDAYTGKPVDPIHGSAEHVTPKSKGGKRDWTNCVYVHRDVNSKRGNKPLREAGLKLRQKPRVPRKRVKAESIPARYPEWLHFVAPKKKKS